ncbi:hypothetical protein TNCV_3077561 [Trichonephila clavipes]|nr:hypothetical protein TNCV_3077561 [Trichonephila clavipes]
MACLTSALLPKHLAAKFFETNECPKHKVIAILMVTHEMFQADRHALFPVCRGQLSGHLSCCPFPVSKKVIDILLRKVDDIIKVNRRITINGVEKELGIGYEGAQKMQSPEFCLQGFLKLVKGYDKCLNVLDTYGENKVIPYL